MDVGFVGGPFDGETHVVDPAPETDGVIYWPPDAALDPGRTDVPGDEGAAEYIYRGDGTAAYVGGLVEPGEGDAGLST